MAAGLRRMPPIAAHSKYTAGENGWRVGRGWVVGGGPGGRCGRPARGTGGGEGGRGTHRGTGVVGTRRIAWGSRVRRVSGRGSEIYICICHHRGRSRAGSAPIYPNLCALRQCGILPDPNLNEGFSLAAGRRSWSATTTNALPRLSGCDLALTRRGPFQPRCVHEATKIALGQRAFVVCTLWLVDRGCGLASTHHTAGTHYAPALFTLHDSRHIGTRERRSHLSITLSTRVPQALFVSLTCQTSEYTYAHSAHKHIRTRRFPPFLPLSALAFPVRF